MFRMKKKMQRILILVGSILLTVLAVVGLSKATGVAEWNFREPNPDNLYSQISLNPDIKDGIVADGEKGVLIELDDDNRIKINGTADEDVTYAIGTVTLPAGTYVFDSDINNGSKGSVYMSLMNGESVVAEGYRGEVVFTLATECTVTVTVTIKGETDVNKTLEPVICKGTSADDLVSFWG